MYVKANPSVVFSKELTEVLNALANPVPQKIIVPFPPERSETNPASDVNKFLESMFRGTGRRDAPTTDDPQGTAIGGPKETIFTRPIERATTPLL